MQDRPALYCVMLDQIFAIAGKLAYRSSAGNSRA